jgi:hypothetical protein
MTGYSASYAIVDSGTSLFFLNQYLYDQITNQYFQGCNIYSSSIQCPCSMTSSFPNFTFYFQGAKTYIYNTNYTIGCSAMFGPISDLGGILLGDTFMRNYIVTFDKGNSQVGFKGYSVWLTQRTRDNLSCRLVRNRILLYRRNSDDGAGWHSLRSFSCSLHNSLSQQKAGNCSS